MAAIFKEWYDVITPPPFVGLIRNLAGGCKMTCWCLQMSQYVSRK